MSNEIIKLSDEDKRAIDEAATRLHFISKDEYGNKTITMYADYNDTNEGLIQNAYDNRKIAFEVGGDSEPDNVLLYTLKDTIYDWYEEHVWEIEDAILRVAGFDPSDDMAELQKEYLRETYCITPEYDHFLNQTMNVNIMLGFDEEANRDFVSIYEQRQVMTGDYDISEVEATLEEESGLSWLVKQQGHTMDELNSVMNELCDFWTTDEAKALKDYDERYSKFRDDHNTFLTSVCQELNNFPNYMGVMTILSSMSMYEFAEMMKPGKEIVIPMDATLGVFNPWNGGGSLLEIELEKELVIPSEAIWDVQIEGAALGHQYSVDSVYGLIDRNWKNLRTIRDAEVSDKKISLDNIIHSATERAANNAVNDVDRTGQERS